MAKKGSQEAGTAGLLEQVHQLRGEIVTILEVYLDQAEAVLATLEARLSSKGAGLDGDDAARLAGRLAKLQRKLKPSRGRAKDLGRVERLIEGIEEMLDGGEPAPKVCPTPPAAASRAPRKPKVKAARRPRA